MDTSTIPVTTKIAFGAALLLATLAFIFRFSDHPTAPVRVASITQAEKTVPEPDSRAREEAVIPRDEPAVSKTSRDVAVVSDASRGAIISKIKGAVTRSGSRHSYTTFAKLAEMVDAKNVREIMAYVETLGRAQEKSMLTSLFLGRWAELEPEAAMAYAQTLPRGSARDWAIASAVGGWVERDPAAATAWVQRLSAGPARDQAMHTIVAALAEKD